MKTTCISVAALALFVGSAATAQPIVHDGHEAHGPGGHGSQTSTDPQVAAFVDQAREAGLRYQDRRKAISDGYRRLGPDFPSMGEHWIHPGRMVAAVLDPDYPQALSYAHIDGEPTLTGVIYAKPLLADEPYPDFPPGVSAWHDHSGSIDEELVLLQHSMGDEGGPSGVRLAMLHVWLSPANPSGVFESDNWALPFARLALPQPDRIDINGAKALSLMVGGDTYYLLLFNVLAAPRPEEDALVRERVGRAREEVESWVARRPAGAPVEQSEQVMLGDLWTELWGDIGQLVSIETSERLHPLLTP